MAASNEREQGLIRLLLLRTLGPIIGRFPGTFYHIADALAWFAWSVRPAARRRIVRNLLPLLDGDPTRARAASLDAYKNVARYWVDVMSLPYRDVSMFEERHLTVEFGERLRVLEGEVPAIAVSAHTGNPDLAVQALTGRGRQFAALVEPLRPQALADHLLDVRSAPGGRFLEADFDGLRQAMRALRQGTIIGVLADRDIQRNGMCMELAGRQVKLPTGPWEMARSSRAIVIPVFTNRTKGDHFRVVVEEPFGVRRTTDKDADVREAMERWALLLEVHLRRDPGQWAVLEDFWKVHSCGEG